jgi:imidazole glycerol-phosphate synthase subunit HisF
MIIGDMERKRVHGLKKVTDAIEAHHGTTLLSTGITGDDARAALAAVEAGARLLEPNHPAVALARGHKGVRTMHAAEDLRHEISTDDMAKVVKVFEMWSDPDIYITVGASGTFTEVLPTPFTEEDAYKLSMAGADGLHTHKSTIKDLADITTIAHKYGLLIDAYIAHPSDRHLFGIPAESVQEVSDYAKAMQDVGVDLIGLMTGMSYEGVSAGEIAPETRARLDAMMSAVSVPTLAEGGINTQNFKAFIGTGVNILVVGTSIDDMVRQAVRDAVKIYVDR